MALKSVTIHIGPQKTATTFIQQCLAAIRPALRGRNIALINRAEMVELDDFDYWAAFRRTNPDRAEMFTKELSELVERRVDELKGRSARAIFSNESFVGVPQPEYTDWPRAEAALTQAFRAIGCDDIRLVAYTRRQDTWIESMYMQRIHAGQTFNFKWYMKKRIKGPNIRYTSLFDRLSELPGVSSLHVRPFEIIRGGGDKIMSDLLGQIGCADLAAVANEVEPTNTSYSVPAWKAARLVNDYASGRGSDERLRIRNALRAAFPIESYAKPVLLSKRRREEILEAYRAENEDLFRRYMPDLPVDSYSSVDATARLADLA